MNLLRIATALLLPVLPSAVLAQTPAPSPAETPAEPLVADVHTAPYRPSIDWTLWLGQRFEMRNATVVNLLDFVLGHPDDDGREDPAIVGGPTWIDLDRFDLVALLPTLNASSANSTQPAGAIAPATSDKLRPVVARILAERFHLQYHREDRPLPGYLITIGKEGAKLPEAKDPTAAGSCRRAADPSGVAQILVTCTSATIPQFLASFAEDFRHPILDRTGLEKSYDFILRLPIEQFNYREGRIHAYIDGCSRQLGLVITPGDVPQPAWVVDAVDRVPAPNPPETAKLIPPQPDLDFEVATIKPATNGEPRGRTRFSGSQVSLISFSLQDLLTRAWELPSGAMLGQRPDWLLSTRYTLQMKLPPGVDAHDSALFDQMLRKLLTDRFQIKLHWGEQIVPDADVLLAAGSSKMKKADPASRTFCKYGPAEGQKDARLPGSPFNGMFHCQNVTMDQFADLAQAVAGAEIKYRPRNKTGLAGAWNFSLFFTGTSRMNAYAAAAQAAAKQAGSASPDPIAGLGIEDAFRRQLGLRLEKERGTYTALVLDHIEQTPTEN